jgi:DNA-binding Lrp family transcriptional regulator
MNEQYLNIPFSILFNLKLTSDEKLILAEIVSLNKLRNGCTASDNHFAKMINKSRQTTNGIIKKLESKGLLNINVRPGIGKKTKLADNFWELINIPVEIEDTLESIQVAEVVVESDTTCRNSLQVGVDNQDTTCREFDTTITSTNTDILLQEEIQYTGATSILSIEYQKINRLLSTDPANITNEFLLKFQDYCFQLEIFFGSSIFEQMYILRTNQEIYQIYETSNLYGIRDELNYVKSNIDRFLRQFNLE